MSQIALAKQLRSERGFIACHEVSNYGCRADVLAVDTRKRLIYEYEFKCTPADLKVSEFKKSKYGKYDQWKSWQGKDGLYKSCYLYNDFPKPNYFYFVVTDDLWKKEEAFLRRIGAGVIILDSQSNYRTEIRSRKNMSNVFKYHRVYENICTRLANYYVWQDIEPKTSP